MPQVGADNPMPSKNHHQDKHNDKQYCQPLDGVWVFSKFVAANRAGFAFCVYFHRT